MKCHQNIYSICVKKWSPLDYGDGPAGFRQGHPHRATKGVHVGGYMRRGSKHDVPYGITVLKNGNGVPPEKSSRDEEPSSAAAKSPEVGQAVAVADAGSGAVV